MTAYGVDPAGLAMYHVGLVVEDLEETAARYSDLLGLRFAHQRAMTVEVRVDGEPRRSDILVRYSMDGPPYVELIEEKSGGIWGGLGLSHVGFWAPDLRAAASRLAGSGLPAVVHDVVAGGEPARFTYHRGDGGFWIELVDPSFAPSLEAWIVRSRREPTGE